MNKDLLHLAIENLGKNLSIDIKYEIEYEFLQKDNYQIDGKLVFLNEIPFKEFSIEMKNNLSLSVLSHLIKLNEKINNLLVVSDYISKPLKEKLRQKNISYLDAAGNFYLKKENLFIYIETNKTNRNNFKKINKAFSPAGLKVIYNLLIVPNLLTKSYRDIAEQSTVSIHTVGKVIKELLRDGYIIKESEKNYIIRDKERLFQDWVTLFNKVLRPKLKQKNYESLKNKQELFDSVKQNDKMDSVGGELAAQILTDYLIAENIYFYTEDAFLDISKEHRLIPSENGSVRLIEKFWKSEKSSKQLTVHTILVYADLLDNPTPRNIETAQLLFQKHIKDYVKTTL
ncbi:MAG: hypothetical protein COZ18_16085 [Flexibacter sp. CG_4_10_14_3_um_filter_32_15]|nr:MAG: hypothetical protein COZ18_16085 [Flexibacter sp. CG_4_10_14_3_um_filter_32_15]